MPNPDHLLTRARRAQRRAFPSTARRVEGTASHGEQQILAQQYRTAIATGATLPTLADAEFCNYSQNGEDGILLLLATALDLPRRVVELGAGDGIECNSANLIIHHGWDGLLIDGNNALIEHGRRFYACQPETVRIGPTFVNSWITAGNATALIPEGALGVLSVDVDGMDLWVLEALEPTATVLVVEFNNRLPADTAITVPYREDFAAEGDRMRGEGYFGASLQAFVNLLSDYRLVGANSVNTNAFFVRKTIGERLLPEVPAASCLVSPWARAQTEKWWPSLKTREWVSV